MKNYLKGKPITDATMWQYLDEKFNNPDLIEIQRMKVCEGVPALLQDDYGLDGDCTVTSMTCLLNFIHGTKIQLAYDMVEHIDMQYGYNGVRGTNPFLINKILRKAEFRLNVVPTIWNVGYGKGIGYNFETIVRNVKKNHPMILSMPTDGRGYYANHSVTVVGYAEYRVNKKRQRFLMLHDNWHKEVVYLDYELLSLFSSLNSYL